MLKAKLSEQIFKKFLKNNPFFRWPGFDRLFKNSLQKILVEKWFADGQQTNFTEGLGFHIDFVIFIPVCMNIKYEFFESFSCSLVFYYFEVISFNNIKIE